MRVVRRRMPWNLTHVKGLGRRLGCGPGRQVDLATGLLDGGDRRRRGTRDLHFNLGLDLALAKQAHPVQRLLEEAGGLHGGGIDRLGSVEALVVDRLLQRTEIDHLPGLGMRRPEAALGDAPIKRHLAAFEALDGDAGARLLALHAPAGGLALARADAAAHAHARLAGPRIVGDLVQSHDKILQATSSSTRTRWRTLLIMPRTSGVSTSSRLRWRLFSPRPISVARWSSVRPIGLPVWVILIFLASAMTRSLRRRLGRGGSRLVAPAQEIADLLAAAGGDHARRVELLQRLEGGLDHVVRV